MKAPDGDKAKALYHSVFITRADRSDINSLQDVKGKKMAFVDPGSTSGNPIPTSMLMKPLPMKISTAKRMHMNEKFSRRPCTPASISQHPAVAKAT